MKTKVVGIVLLLAIVVLGATSCTTLGCDCSEVADLQARLEVVEKRVQFFEQQETQRWENDRAIFLRDPGGFVENGLVGLGPQYEVYDAFQIQDQDGNSYIEYVFKLNGVPGLVDNSTGEWVKIDAVRGETIQLIGYRFDDGPQEIAYYTCYTNSTHCTADTTTTGVLTGE
jgi:hypothetical protein